jgi:hypothetical protein
LSGTRRPQGWLRRGFALLAAACALVSFLARHVQAAEGETAALPAGYVSEQLGPVRWTYPSVALDEARELQAHERHAFARVANELGASVAPELDIRIARNPTEMQALAPQGAPLPGYADGIAFPKSGIILLTLTEPRSFLRPDMKRVLTHELSHIALHRALHGAKIPHWFSEGVAVHQAGEHSLGRMRTLWEGTLRGNLVPLDRLSRGFPGTLDAVDLAYAQSADFVGFLRAGDIERANFRKLLAHVAEGQAFPDAVKNSYRVPLNVLEHTWRQTLTQRFGRWPALLMGLTIVWVLGAVLLAIAYVRSRRKHQATLRRWAIEEAPLSPMQVTAPPPPPPPPAQSQLDDFFDRSRKASDAGVPTVVHDGQAHTLH